MRPALCQTLSVATSALRANGLRCLVPLLAVVAFCTACTSATTGKPPTGALKLPVTVPTNCPLGRAGNLTAHVFVGLKATARSGVTEKQASAAIAIPDDTTMPCASGVNYVVGPPVGVDIYFLPGATVADQNRAAGTLRASGRFSVVTVVPRP